MLLVLAALGGDSHGQDRVTGGKEACREHQRRQERLEGPLGQNLRYTEFSKMKKPNS